MHNKFKESINQFLQSTAFGVVGASSDHSKYGNKVLRCYLQHNKIVYPVNKQAKSIEGLNCYSSVIELPAAVTSISIITPPKVTEQIVAAAIAKGINNIWLQPGAESEAAVISCQQHKVNVIFGGPCILVTLGFKDLS